MKEKIGVYYMKLKIGFIGAGNMGKAMLLGMINSKKVDASSLYVYDQYEQAIIDLKQLHDIHHCESEVDVARNVDVIILAVKPYGIETVLNTIKSVLKPETIVVSIAAGVTLKQMHAHLTCDTKIVRCMPNTPALVQEGMSMLCDQGSLSDQERVLVRELFSCFGKADYLDEKHMDAFIGISGSSPAYVYMFIEAMADAAVLKGLPRNQAYMYASQAVLGAAKMVLESGIHPGQLKDNVCSPGGTTIEAVTTLEKTGFRASIIEAVLACIEKSEKMSRT